MHLVDKKFANHRGLIRTLLADLMWRLGPYRKYGRVDWERVQRLVFICQGNICRSPFAKYVALAQNSTLPVESFGLATSTGAVANPMALNVARDFGFEMGDHRATDITDFTVCEGDLLIVMEDRHITWLQPHLDHQDTQVCLLGLWCRPRFALLYDPINQSRNYFSSCFDRIDRATRQLVQDSQGFR